MGFVIRDLAINVGRPQEVGPAFCINWTWWCGGCTYQTCWGCSYGFTIHCLPHTQLTMAPVVGPGCGQSFDPGPGGAVNPSDLAAIKAQLQQALASVEAQEQAAAPDRAPQTVEEVDMLTGKLTEAMEELKARRAELQGKEKK